MYEHDDDDVHAEDRNIDTTLGWAIDSIKANPTPWIVGFGFAALLLVWAIVA